MKQLVNCPITGISNVFCGTILLNIHCSKMLNLVVCGPTAWISVKDAVQPSFDKHVIYKRNSRPVLNGLAGNVISSRFSTSPIEWVSLLCWQKRYDFLPRFLSHRYVCGDILRRLPLPLFLWCHYACL